MNIESSYNFGVIDGVDRKFKTRAVKSTQTATAIICSCCRTALRAVGNVPFRELLVCLLAGVTSIWRICHRTGTGQQLSDSIVLRALVEEPGNFLKKIFHGFGQNFRTSVWFLKVISAMILYFSVENGIVDPTILNDVSKLVQNQDIRRICNMPWHSFQHYWTSVLGPSPWHLGLVNVIIHYSTFLVIRSLMRRHYPW